MKKADAIIIGGGIAGCLMAYEYLKRDLSVLLFDANFKQSSSRVAAGIFNPIMLKRFSKAWMAEYTFEYLQSYYPELENFLASQFYHQTGLVKLFSQISEQNKWMSLTEKNKTKAFISIEKPDLNEEVNAAFSGGKVLQSGWVNTQKLCEAMHQKLKENYVEKHVNQQDIQLKAQGIEVHLENEIYCGKQLIFAQGVYGTHNAFFDKVPFTPTKGEVLEIKTELKTSQILHKGGFMVPTQENCYKVGTTYNKTLDRLPSLEGEKTLLEVVKKITSLDVRIEGHLAGIRPNIRDRRPVLGRSPKSDDVFIFNGLGSKGVSLGPFFADQLYQHIACNKPLNSEVDYARF